MEMLSCFFSVLFLISGTEEETVERCGWVFDYEGVLKQKPILFSPEFEKSVTAVE